ncbi:MAG: SAM-dependent methyltransferase, partial [Chloroflexota bacterium]|nr:SAM-dependent methyltransferase [Chloroflexota bacterium]
MSNEGAGGKVFLVGAGPGDSGLITRRGASLIQQADVIIYDRLVGSGVLDLAADSAELVDVGKTPGKSNISQLDINHLLIDKAKRGQTVVRLKGGDPFVFGRGAEEAAAL